MVQLPGFEMPLVLQDHWSQELRSAISGFAGARWAAPCLPAASEFGSVFDFGGFVLTLKPWK